MSRSDYGAILSTVIKDTSDAIREAKVSSALIAPSSWGSEIRSISDNLNSIVEGTVTNLECSATKIGKWTFYNCTTLRSVNLPLATTSDGYSFFGCSNLLSVNLPSLTTLGGNDFYNCTSLTSVNLPLLTTLASGSNFINCSSLTSINLPLLTVLYSGVFDGCSSLTSISIPNVTGKISVFAFQQCSQLPMIEFLKPVSFDYGVFDSCSSLKTLILRANQVCALDSVYVFDGSPFASGGTGGTVYVPQALISNYRSASVWSTLLKYPNNKILAIEGSPYE